MNAEYSSAWNPARAVAANHASWPARYELLDGLRERPFLARPPNRALLTRNHGTQR